MVSRAKVPVRRGPCRSASAKFRVQGFCFWGMTWANISDSCLAMPDMFVTEDFAMD
jgi:hypothetical protein